MITRGVVGAQWIKRRIDRDPKEEVTVEVRMPREMADRLGVVRAITGETYGRIILRALETLLKGVRLPSIPAEMLESIRATRTPRKAKVGEAAPDSADSTLPIAENVTSIDTNPHVPEAGAEEGRAAPLPPKKLTPAELRSRLPQTRGRKAS